MDWHFVVSLLKSILRIVGCIVGFTGSIWGLAFFFLLAEMLGVLEEIEIPKYIRRRNKKRKRQLR